MNVVENVIVAFIKVFYYLFGAPILDSFVLNGTIGLLLCLSPSDYDVLFENLLLLQIIICLRMLKDLLNLLEE